ncbi:hypothetical protein [Stenotrophomonas lactitubi]
MVMTGVPLRRVQILAGHADYATTEQRSTMRTTP